MPVAVPIDLLKRLDFGKQIAEEEGDDLARYFVETDQWRQLHEGQVDIIYGPKGAGKSALYSLLVSWAANFRDRGILLATAEKLRGTPVFRHLAEEAPIGENEFVGL